MCRTATFCSLDVGIFVVVVVIVIVVIHVYINPCICSGFMTRHESFFNLMILILFMPDVICDFYIFSAGCNLWVVIGYIFCYIPVLSL